MKVLFFHLNNFRANQISDSVKYKNFPFFDFFFLALSSLFWFYKTCLKLNTQGTKFSIRIMAHTYILEYFYYYLSCIVYNYYMCTEEKHTPMYITNILLYCFAWNIQKHRDSTHICTVKWATFYYYLKCIRND